MYYLNGSKEVIKTIYLLSKPYLNDGKTLADLKKAYLMYLRKNQSHITHPNNDDSIFLFDKQTIHSLIKEFTLDCILTDIETSIDETSLESMTNALNAIGESFEHFQRIEPNLFEIFRLTIHTCFYYRSGGSGGGSTSSAIGAIWCSPRKSWTSQDVLEFLVHELTHNLIFLDEHRYQHYLSLEEIAKTENYAVSAVLKIARP